MVLLTDLHIAYNYVINQPASTWTTVGSYVGGSAIVATVLQFFKKKFNLDEARKLILFLAGFLSFLVAAANDYLQTTPQSPTTLVHTTLFLTAVATFVHCFAVSPTTEKLLPKFQAFFTAVATVQAAKKPLNTTAGTTSAVPEPAEVETFKV